MDSPFIIVIVVVLAFASLIIFSMLGSPVDNGSLFKRDIKGEYPIVKMNRAISSGDVSRCDNDINCETLFVFTEAMKSGNPEDCAMIKDEESKINCRDNAIFSKATSSVVVDKELCSQINDIKIRGVCERI